jgi:hypothetical protein
MDHTSIHDKFDPRQLSIPRAQIPLKTKLHPPWTTGGMFLKGPVPMEWLASARRLKGAALSVGIVLWHLSGLQKSNTVKWQPKMARRFGLGRQVWYRGLNALERVGLVTIVRSPGMAPTVIIHAVKGNSPGGLSPPNNNPTGH